MQHIQSCISYTRIITLALSILIVVSSLCIYNSRSIPVYSLLDTIQQGKDMVNEMIQDRRLIATLVASQASIFCPLFLLMNTHGENKKPSTALVIEQFFQCLMPIGLVISWCFCIGFDRNVKAVLGIEDHWMEVLLRYSVVAVLMVEILLIWTESLNCLLAVHKEGNIRLPDEECAILEKELE